jgi:hypothetical protein
MVRGQLLGVMGLALAVGGCQPQGKPSSRPTTALAATQASEGAAEGAAAASAGGGGLPVPAPVDPRPARAGEQLLIGLDAYVISVPAGAVSRSEEFWKRVDEEDAIAPATYQMLRTNGVRVGVASMDDWGSFKQLIDQQPASTQMSSYVTLRGKALELEMDKDVASENIWVFGADGEKGRTYENCSNLWSLSFQPVPREPDHTHVALTPLVRSQRKRLEVVMRRAHPEDPPEREILYRSPEWLFDLGLDVTVPPGKFVVVAPSTEAMSGTVGDVFLMGEGLGQRAEKVILLVPRRVPAQVRTEIKAAAAAK